jgi:hypothetical protein
MERADYSELGDVYRKRIDELFQRDIRKGVADYLEPSGVYAARSFDEGVRTLRMSSPIRTFSLWDSWTRPSRLLHTGN